MGFKGESNPLTYCPLPIPYTPVLGYIGIAPSEGPAAAGEGKGESIGGSRRTVGDGSAGGEGSAGEADAGGLTIGTIGFSVAAAPPVPPLAGAA